MIQVWTFNVLTMRSRGQTEKSQNGQKQHRTKGPKDKIKSGQNPQKRKYFNTSTISRCTIHDHMIQVWTINVLAMRSRERTEKSQNGQKQHRTKGTKDKNQKRTKPPKKRKYFNTSTISRCTIP